MQIYLFFICAVLVIQHPMRLIVDQFLDDKYYIYSEICINCTLYIMESCIYQTLHLFVMYMSVTSDRSVVFLRLLPFPQPIKLTRDPTEILLKVAFNANNPPISNNTLYQYQRSTIHTSPNQPQVVRKQSLLTNKRMLLARLIKILICTLQFQYAGLSKVGGSRLYSTCY